MPRMPQKRRERWSSGPFGTKLRRVLNFDAKFAVNGLSGHNGLPPVVGLSGVGRNVCPCRSGRRNWLRERSRRDDFSCQCAILRCGRLALGTPPVWRYDRTADLAGRIEPGFADPHGQLEGSVVLASNLLHWAFSTCLTTACAFS